MALTSNRLKLIGLIGVFAVGVLLGVVIVLSLSWERWKTGTGDARPFPIPDGVGVVEAASYTCTGGGGGNVAGKCADAWYDFGLPDCGTVQFWCEWGGGTFTKVD